MTTHSPAGGTRPPAVLYLPIADEQATGMQRFGSEIIRALIRLDPDLRVLIGRVDGKPAWLEGIPYTTIHGDNAKSRIPRPMQPVARLLWLKFVLPRRLGRGATVVSLAGTGELPVLRSVRHIAVAHDLTQMRSYAFSRSSAERVRQRLIASGLKKAQLLIAISRATRDDLVETLNIKPERLHVIYEGYDPAVFKPPEGSPPPPRPYLLYAGTLAPNKNIPFLLAQYARLREKHDIDLVLAGKQDPAAVAALLEAVPEHARPGVRFIGFVSDDELARLMQQCTAFVFPSLNEGFGLAVVEAMACGAPIISSPSGSLREVVDQGGELLDPQDGDAWVDAMDRVVSDPQLRADLSRRARLRASDFSWDEAAASYLALIRGGTPGRDGGPA